MNYQTDVIIIGDSKEGYDVIKKLATEKPFIKIAFISRTFKSTALREFLNVEYIKDEVVFTDYKNRLFGCYLKSGDRFYCTHLIVASGISYTPLIIEGKQIPGVFNEATNINKTAKTLQAVVIGQNDADVKLALAVAKKYKHVYLCTKSINLDITEACRKKLLNTENIVVLPNASIVKANTVEGVLKTVELDNYSTLTCSAIFVKTETTPETTFISDKLINKSLDGYLITTEDLESTLVPKCFAIGNCAQKSTKKMLGSMIEKILEDF